MNAIETTNGWLSPSLQAVFCWLEFGPRCTRLDVEEALSEMTHPDILPSKHRAKGAAALDHARVVVVAGGSPAWVLALVQHKIANSVSELWVARDSESAVFDLRPRRDPGLPRRAAELAIGCGGLIGLSRLAMTSNGVRRCHMTRTIPTSMITSRRSTRRRTTSATAGAATDPGGEPAPARAGLLLPRVRRAHRPGGVGARRDAGRCAGDAGVLPIDCSLAEEVPWPRAD